MPEGATERGRMPAICVVASRDGGGAEHPLESGPVFLMLSGCLVENGPGDGASQFDINIRAVLTTTTLSVVYCRM